MSNIKPNDIVSAQGLKATIDTLRNLKSNEHIDRRQDVNSVAQAMETDEEGAFAYIYPEGYLMYFKESSVYQNVEYPAGEYRYLGGNWISTQTFDGDYNSLENKPYIDNVPTTGSSNLITSGGVAEAFNAIINEIKTSIVGVYKYKGTVDKYSPSEGDESDTTYLIGDNGVTSPENGDVYNVKDTGMNYAWNADEAQWDALGSDIPEELSNDEINAICQ